jgi:hypothetical protein
MENNEITRTPPPQVRIREHGPEGKLARLTTYPGTDKEMLVEYLSPPEVQAFYKSAEAQIEAALRKKEQPATLEFIAIGEDGKYLLHCIEAGKEPRIRPLTVDEEAEYLRVKSYSEHKYFAERLKGRDLYNEAQNVALYGTPEVPNKPDASLLLKATKRLVDQASVAYVPRPLDPDFKKFALDHVTGSTPEVKEKIKEIREKLQWEGPSKLTEAEPERPDLFLTESTLLNVSKRDLKWSDTYWSQQIKIQAKVYRNPNPPQVPFLTALSVQGYDKHSDVAFDMTVDDNLSVEALISIRDMLNRTIDAQLAGKKAL